MTLRLESPQQADVQSLIAELDAYQQSLYPAESVYSLDLASLPPDSVLFAVARDAGGRARACGAIVVTPDFGELKRMYVHPDSRGRGLATRLLALLEEQALARGCRLLTLETGIHQPQAIALYARHGYQRRGPYGGYPDDPLSVFMEKPVAPPDSLADIRARLRAFAQERDWDQFHTPKNLAMALSVEVAELVEHYQWLPTGADGELDDAKRAGIRHELADVLMYLVRLADKSGVDLHAAVLEKMQLNALKYPAQQVRGDARKYSEY